MNWKCAGFIFCSALFLRRAVFFFSSKVKKRSRLFCYVQWVDRHTRQESEKLTTTPSLRSIAQFHGILTSVFRVFNEFQKQYVQSCMMCHNSRATKVVSHFIHFSHKLNTCTHTEKETHYAIHFYSSEMRCILLFIYVITDKWPMIVFSFLLHFNLTNVSSSISNGI